MVEYEFKLGEKIFDPFKRERIEVMPWPINETTIGTADTALTTSGKTFFIKKLVLKNTDTANPHTVTLKNGDGDTIMTISLAAGGEETLTFDKFPVKNGLVASADTDGVVNAYGEGLREK